MSTTPKRGHRFRCLGTWVSYAIYMICWWFPMLVFALFLDRFQKPFWLVSGPAFGNVGGQHVAKMSLTIDAELSNEQSSSGGRPTAKEFPRLVGGQEGLPLYGCQGWTEPSLRPIEITSSTFPSLPLFFPFLFSPFLSLSPPFFPSSLIFSLILNQFLFHFGISFRPFHPPFSISILIGVWSFLDRFMNHLNHKVIKYRLENIAFQAFRPLHTW